jgi:hypothetical protein
LIVTAAIERLSQRKQIKERIEALRREFSAAPNVEAIHLRYLQEKLLAIINDPMTEPPAKIRAIETLIKTIPGGFAPAAVAVDVSFDQLGSRLDAATARAKTIDVTPDPRALENWNSLPDKV